MGQCASSDRTPEEGTCSGVVLKPNWAVHASHKRSGAKGKNTVTHILHQEKLM
ncbi:hypothetical protein [Fischerella sp. PCC 9605]|uniref:hypothetical protein n=1 Tax=Fischerella sp. PCC 9605 TaxID=1173024 RepID=UPI0004AE183B|nr:hypothetical protein [Fischerella sp. PCC 9605]